MLIQTSLLWQTQQGRKIGLFLGYYDMLDDWSAISKVYFDYHQLVVRVRELAGFSNPPVRVYLIPELPVANQIDSKKVVSLAMGGTKHQHFIPRSYLRNFATIEGDKQFVEVMNIATGEIAYPRSTRDICVQKNLYTIPKAAPEDKYKLERHYAEHVDTVYPEVYRILTDKTIDFITKEQREKILSTCLSLYFRTPKFLEANNEELDKQIARLRQFDVSPTADLFIEFNGRRHSCKRNGIDDLYQHIKELNKKDFIVSHLQEWQALLKFKSQAGFMVLEVEEEVPLITSDNPVDIYKAGTKKVNPFDPENVIQLTLDRKHFLWISPEFMEGNGLHIVRSPRDKFYALVHNLSVEENAMDWLIGEKGSIKLYKDAAIKYSKKNPENFAAWNDRRVVALKMAELEEVATKYGIDGAATREKIKEMTQIPALQNDPGFQHLLAAIIEHLA